jgi:hypothetical protein
MSGFGQAEALGSGRKTSGRNVGSVRCVGYQGHFIPVLDEGSSKEHARTWLSYNHHGVSCQILPSTHFPIIPILWLVSHADGSLTGKRSVTDNAIDQ